MVSLIYTPKIINIKKENILNFHKVIAFIIPKLVKNIETIGISKISAKGMITLNINLKYLSTVNNSLNIPSFNDNKNGTIDRKSTRLNSSHVAISYAVFCLKKKIKNSTSEY